jgi:hypothetical protein
MISNMHRTSQTPAEAVLEVGRAVGRVWYDLQILAAGVA